jgi:hypothetical protein
VTTPGPRTRDDAARKGEAYAARAAAPVSSWGIAMGPWAWATKVRILFVIDGRVTAGSGEDEFGLGLVLDTLRDQSFAWWVRFEVDVKKRDDPGSFHFTEGGFDLSSYDQVWFFGDWPGELANAAEFQDDMINRPEYSPLSDGELKVIAEWMERGGGVFAAGDHTLLGASMCSRIPRVRTMRKWTHAQGVPSYGDADRNETLYHATGGGLLDWEGDEYPQHIHPVYAGASPVTIYAGFPHPLLCGEHGVIDRFPDHMHEGEVIEDEDIILDKPLEIPGFAGAEYPPFAVPGSVGPGPRPHVIAHGRTTNADAFPRRFGLIGVYDGDGARVGRVVVDSTWHHWFSYNLHGLRAQEPVVYRGMQNYYRNVALWLTTPEQRASMLFASIWGVLVGSQPGAFSRVLDVWEFGNRALDVIGRTASQCLIFELVTTFLPTGSRAVATRTHRNKLRVPLGTPAATVSQAIVGGISKELFEPAYHHILARAAGRHTVLDKDAIRRHGLAGVGAGQHALIDVLADGASDLTALHDLLTDQLDRDTMSNIPIPSDLSESRLAD